MFKKIAIATLLIMSVSACSIPEEILEKGREHKTYQMNKYEISEEFLDKTMSIANDLDMDYKFLLTIMHFESAGTFSPSIKNKYSGATGLIQFMPDRGKKYKTINRKRYYIEDLSKMTAIEQLDVVKEYFIPYKGKVNTLSDLYMCVLYPKAVSKSDSYILFKKGRTSYKQNRSLDKNKDGKITKGEITTILKNH